MFVAERGSLRETQTQMLRETFAVIRDLPASSRARYVRRNIGLR
jgi:hypothetical protein